MNCTRLINDHNSQMISGTLSNGDVIWQAGTYRQRYSPTSETLYYEIKVGGTWYIQTSTPDSSLSAAGLTASTIQETN